MVSMRSIWKGSVAFGLVNVPVKVYAATEEKDVRFHQVHAEDGGRIRYKRVCELDGEIVEYADIAKAYESDDGRTVILTDDDFAQLPSSTSREIEVSSFVPADQIDPLYFDKSYYLEPASTSTKAYVLLLRTLEQTDRIAIVNFALRQKTRLAALRVRDDVLVIQTLLWPDEVRAAEFASLDESVYHQAGRAEDGLHAGGQLRRRFPAGGLHRRLPGRAATADRRETRRRRSIPDAREGGRRRGRRGGRPAGRAAAQRRAAQGRVRRSSRRSPVCEGRAGAKSGSAKSHRGRTVARPAPGEAHRRQAGRPQVGRSPG